MWTAVDDFQQGILGWVLGDHSAETFEPLWDVVATWNCYFYGTDGWKVPVPPVCNDVNYSRSGEAWHCVIAILENHTLIQQRPNSLQHLKIGQT